MSLAQPPSAAPGLSAAAPTVRIAPAQPPRATTRLRRWLPGIAGLMTVTCALALDREARTVPPDGWGPVPQRTDLSAQLDSLAADRLQIEFLACSRAAEVHPLSPGDGALCAATQDAVKHRVFGGDFNALLAWWRLHRNDPLPIGASRPERPAVTRRWPTVGD
ncbi:MAG TPA: hypothetical protein VLE94_14345 [Burkholderiaceae bacterium]|nr:hypothetical protein [Burkholderiaceae bacterium]